VPARPKDRQLDVTVSEWPRSRREAEVFGRLLGGLRPRHTLRRKVDVLDSAISAFVRLFFSVDPETRDAIHQGTYLPASTTALTEFRVPFQLHLRVARFALLHADEGHLRFEVRSGKIRLLRGDEPIVLGPLPPRKHHHREPRKRLELDQIARIYTAAANARAPTQAVMRELNVSRSTAIRRVNEARAEGLLPALRREEMKGGAAVRSKRERKRR
jgi:hypothetical protein